MYYVLGGVYEDTSFHKVKIKTFEIHGPFETYNDAEDKWRERMWLNVDDCHHRVFISELFSDETGDYVLTGDKKYYITRN